MFVGLELEHQAKEYICRASLSAARVQGHGGVMVPGSNWRIQRVSNNIPALVHGQEEAQKPTLTDDNFKCHFLFLFFK